MLCIQCRRIWFNSVNVKFLLLHACCLCLWLEKATTKKKEEGWKMGSFGSLGFHCLFVCLFCSFSRFYFACWRSLGSWPATVSPGTISKNFSSMLQKLFFWEHANVAVNFCTSQQLVAPCRLRLLLNIAVEDIVWSGGLCQVILHEYFWWSISMARNPKREGAI